MWGPVVVDGDSEDNFNADVTDQPLLRNNAAAAPATASDGTVITVASSCDPSKPPANGQRRRKSSRPDLVVDASDNSAMTVDEAMDSFGLGLFQVKMFFLCGIVWVCSKHFLAGSLMLLVRGG